MMKIFDYLKTIPTFSKVINKNNLTIKKSTKEANALLISLDYTNNPRPIFIVLPNTYEAEIYYSLLCKTLNFDDVLFYPQDEFISIELETLSNDFSCERINTIVNIIQNPNKVIVTNITGFLKYERSMSKWCEAIITLKKDDHFDIEDLAKHLVKIGYKKTYTIEHTGEFAIRGSIVDIFPLNYENPVRLDFFDDQIESIKYFDLFSQRSNEETNNIQIIPIKELFYDASKSQLLIESVKKSVNYDGLSIEEKKNLEMDFVDIELSNNLDHLMQYISCFTTSLDTISSFTQNHKTYFIDLPLIKETYHYNIQNYYEYLDNSNKSFKKHLSFFKSLDKMLEEEKNYNVIEGLQDIHGDNEVVINAQTITPYNGEEKAIINDLAPLCVGNNTIIVGICDKDKSQNLKDLLFENKILYQTIRDVNLISGGCVNFINEDVLPIRFLNEHITIFSSDYIFKVPKTASKVRFKSLYQNSSKISRYDELEIGDYIVHANYGIGEYLGLDTLELSGTKRDYLKIRYDGKDKLYIPLEQFNLVHKYHGSEHSIPKLNKIGTDGWNKAKEKVREKLDHISKELISLYAKRSEAKGFKFAPETELERDFKNDFLYDETIDQLKAINDVLSDMESEKPMDRLVLGDVGFGKTEVALRAAFKAVMNGKQVAYLAPTTVLARQHYLTFKSRMEKYGVEVRLLSRFVKTKDANQTIFDLKKGSVDIVVGTHKLLSDNIYFKDLGLLITDEEQRFGALQKEKIKELKVNVDSIMLSATPIPRTLEMSLIGIKDVSMIETPPKNRYPVQTYIMPRSDLIIKEAIEKELARGGQVFYLYNYVSDIEDITNHIATLVPQAKVSYIHGKMDKDKVENILMDFIEHEFNVLITTTIIETGIDIPDANTLIIHNADRLGLSQLYQIRGRVGRSDKIAYAYMMYDNELSLTGDAQKRLETIKEFSELGSGFKVAMRDLSIRGAGDLLGANQSGFMDSVGIDMYMEIMQETIKKEEEKQKPKEEIIQPNVIKNVYSNHFLPSSYIDNDDVKIEVHKKIYNLKNQNDFDNLCAELIDRFGKIPKDVTNYMYEALLQNLVKNFDFEDIVETPDNIRFIFTQQMSAKLDGEHLFVLLNKIGRDLKISYSFGRINVLINKDSNLNWLKKLCVFFENL